jgi:hypothetical protein
LVVCCSNAVNLAFTPLTAATGITFVAKLTVPALHVNPLEAVNVLAQVIVFDVNNPEFVIDADEIDPEFVIDPDDKAPVLVIVFDDKAPVLLIVLDCNVFKVDGPKTFKELVRILSDCRAFETKAFLLNVCGTMLFGNSIDGYEAIIIYIFVLENYFYGFTIFSF